MKRKIISIGLISIITVLSICACDKSTDKDEKVSSSVEIVTSSQNGGGSNTAGDKFQLDVTYSDKEKLSLTKNDLVNYTNILKLNGESITITESGEYVLSGEITDGQIIVDVPEDDDKVVTLILNGVTVNCSDSAAVYVKSAKKVVLSLVDGTENYFSDGASYNYDAGEDEPNACIFSKDDLAISGKGVLNVSGNFNNGIYSKDDLTITGGKINVKAVNDGIKGKDLIAILYSDITVEANGDGMCSDNTIVIDGGDINISQCYEGIEATYITVNDGNIHVISCDDGFNASGEKDSSATQERSGRNSLSGSTGVISFNGGYVYINSSGDGIDANGEINITDGYIIVDGPASGGNGAIDYDSGCKITGGFLLAVGYSQMAQMPSEAAVNCVMIGFDQYIDDELINISDSNNKSIITFKGSKNFNNMVLCTSDFIIGETYTVSIGGNVDGDIKDGICSGTYSGGEVYENFTIQGNCTD